MDPRNPTAPLAWRRALLVLFVCLGLTLDLAVPHDIVAEQAGVAGGMEIAEEAAHPGDPTHFEAAELKVHPGCTACLLQLQAGAVLGLPPVPRPLEQDSDTIPPVRLAASRDASLLGPARAPPTSSPFV